MGTTGEDRTDGSRAISDFGDQVVASIARSAISSDSFASSRLVFRSRCTPEDRESVSNYAADMPRDGGGGYRAVAIGKKMQGGTRPGPSPAAMRKRTPQQQGGRTGNYERATSENRQSGPDWQPTMSLARSLARSSPIVARGATSRERMSEEERSTRGP